MSPRKAAARWEVPQSTLLFSNQGPRTALSRTKNSSEAISRSGKTTSSIIIELGRPRGACKATIAPGICLARHVETGRCWAFWKTPGKRVFSSKFQDPDSQGKMLNPARLNGALTNSIDAFFGCTMTPESGDLEVIEVVRKLCLYYLAEKPCAITCLHRPLVNITQLLLIIFDRIKIANWKDIISPCQYTQPSLSIDVDVRYKLNFFIITALCPYKAPHRLDTHTLRTPSFVKG